VAIPPTAEAVGFLANKIMKVIFFNHFHNGDVHVSRGFIRQIMAKMPGVSFEYSHRNPSNLLADIPGLVYNPNSINQVGNEHISLNRTGDTVYFNTWYAQQRHKHMNKYGITFDSLYAGIDENCQNALGFSLSNISRDPKVFFPTIDYSRFQIVAAQEWVNSHLEKKIIVENGQAMSGQAHNFDMTTAAVNIARNHMDKIFIFTNHASMRLPDNCIYSDNIIKKQQRSDLNEISFLSTHCDMVIGRASGVFSFCLTQQNLFERKMKYLCFSNLVPTRSGKFWLGTNFQDTISYSSTILTSNESNINNIQDIIEGNL
jgi:hypothetical protein